MAAESRQIVWIDAGGRTRVTVPTADPTVSGIMGALALKSNAVVYSWFEGPLTVTGNLPGTGIFPDVQDLARLTFTDGTSLVNLALPAPQESIFLSDSVTVDSTKIGGIITACVGHLLSTAGNPVTAFVAGIRNQRSSGS